MRMSKELFCTVALAFLIMADAATADNLTEVINNSTVVTTTTAAGITPISIAFVVDTTGSMAEEIEGAMKGITRILNGVVHQPSNNIKHFVIVPVNDPDVGPVLTTTNETEFLSTFGQLFASEGTDCAEPLIRGIQLAIDAALPSSLVFVITDASSSDFNLKSEIIHQIQTKQIELVFIITGSCNDDEQDPGYAIYAEAAKLSNGHLFRANESDVEQAINYLVIKQNSVLLDALDTDDISILQLRDFEIDSSLENFTISVSGDTPLVMLSDPDGQPYDTFESIAFLDNVKIIRVVNPAKGTWFLSTQDSSGNETHLRISGESRNNFHLEYAFAIERNSSELTDLHERPVASMPNYIRCHLSGFATGLVAFPQLLILNLRGETIETLQADVDDDDAALKYIAGPFNFTDAYFRLKFIGVDSNGVKFSRASKTAISPQVDPCESRPCGEHGKCSISAEDSRLFVCSCHRGWEGSDCKSEICPDLSQCPTVQIADPCNGHGSYSCDCTFGYSGPPCETTIDWCTESLSKAYPHASFVNVCGNNGTCISEPSKGPRCACLAGFSGQFCEQLVDDTVWQGRRCSLWRSPELEARNISVGCPGNPQDQRCVADDANCQRGRNRCLNPIGWCLPAPRFRSLSSGGGNTANAMFWRFSQFVAQSTCPECPAAEPPCNSLGNAICKCNHGYTGASCENEIDWCKQPLTGTSTNQATGEVCGSNGICVSVPDGPRCVCNDGYTGQFCDIPNLSQLFPSRRCSFDWDVSNCTQIQTEQDYKTVCVPDDSNCLWGKCGDKRGWCLPQKDDYESKRKRR